ncbi:hypothetical protein ACWCQ1_52015, partial [Streptomyces sp. NPDC002144]
PRTPRERPRAPQHDEHSHQLIGYTITRDTTALTVSGSTAAALASVFGLCAGMSPCVRPSYPT